jgi:hypothetical protein
VDHDVRQRGDRVIRHLKKGRKEADDVAGQNEIEDLAPAIGEGL